MIIGIGTDIVLIKRVTDAIKNERFLQKYYSENEIKLIKNNYKIAASNFSVKESYVKALGTGFRNIDLKEIEVLRDDLGKPYINLLGLLKMKNDINTNVFVTISHSDEYVTSTVVIEGL